MADSFSIIVNTVPVGCKTNTINGVVSLVDFGFTAKEVAQSKRAYIHSHDETIMLKWAPDAPATATTKVNPHSGGLMPTYTAPVPSATSGHPVAPSGEREIFGQRALDVLRIWGSAALVTITLEG